MTKDQIIEDLKRIYKPYAPKEEVFQVAKKLLEKISDLKTTLQAEILIVSKENGAQVKEALAEFDTCEKRLINLIKNTKDSSSKDIKTLEDKFKGELESEIEKVYDALDAIPQFDSSELEAKIAEVIKSIPEIKEETPEETRDKLETLKEDERLDISAIKGWDKTIEDLKASGKNVRLVGGPRGIQLYVDGTKVGQVNMINLIAGTNMTLTYVRSFGRNDIIFDASGGGGSFTKLTATGTVDGSNTSFTFTSAPVMIIVDGGRAMQKVSSDGTVNWTGTTSVSLTVAPNFDIYAF